MAIYHLCVKNGSRDSGQSARAKYDYIEREGRYEKDRDELEHSESGNMPEWAEDDPRKYWATADEHERANGRLFREVEFALPVELNEAQRRELAVEFAKELTGAERLPYTLAIHRGEAQEAGKPNNPHCHLMISERGLDGHDRDAERWFKRYNKSDPAKGGARKSTATRPQEWLEDTRERWADHANSALERIGSRERIHEGTLEEQFFDAVEDRDEAKVEQLQGREAGVHIGPTAAAIERGREGRPPQETERGDLWREVQQNNENRLELDAATREADAATRDVADTAAEIASMEARLKEIYDRARAAIDKRLEQVGRAIRTGADAAVRTGEELVRARSGVGAASERVGRAIRTGADAAVRTGEELVRARSGVYQRTQGGTDTVSDVGQQLRRAATSLRRTRERFDGCLQQSRESFGRASAMIRFEIDHKRKERERGRHFEGRFESVYRSRTRRRGHDFEI